MGFTLPPNLSSTTASASASAASTYNCNIQCLSRRMVEKRNTTKSSESRKSNSYISTPKLVDEYAGTSANLIAITSSSSNPSVRQQYSSANPGNLDAHVGMRVAIFTSSWWVLDGVTLTLRKLVRYLQSVGVEYRIYTTNARLPSRLQPHERDHIHVISNDGCIDLHMNDYKFGFGMTMATRKDLEAFQPDILHVSTPDLTGYDMIYWAKNHDRCKCIATWHSNYADYIPHMQVPCAHFVSMMITIFLRSYYRHCRVTYVPTKFIRDKMTREGYETLGINKLDIWGRSVDLDIFNPGLKAGRDSFRAQHKLPLDAVIVLWVGRCVREKSTEVYAYVLERLKLEGHDNVIGLVIGNGPEHDNLTRPSNVRRLEWQNQTMLGHAYASSDLLLFPSSVETFGNVTLEAMACGIPCVVNKGCSEHLVQNSVNGFTCFELDYEAYYDAVRNLVVDPDLRKTMGQNGYRIAETWKDDDLGHKMVQNYLHQMCHDERLSYPKDLTQLNLKRLQLIFHLVFMTMVHFFTRNIFTPVCTPIVKFLWELRWN